MIKNLIVLILILLISGCSSKNTKKDPVYGKILMHTSICETIKQCINNVKNTCPKGFNIYSKQDNILVFWCSDWILNKNKQELK